MANWENFNKLKPESGPVEVCVSGPIFNYARTKHSIDGDDPFDMAGYRAMGQLEDQLREGISNFDYDKDSPHRSFLYREK